jgi:hypothetical protein
MLSCTATCLAVGEFEDTLIIGLDPFPTHRPASQFNWCVNTQSYLSLVQWKQAYIHLAKAVSVATADQADMQAI